MVLLGLEEFQKGFTDLACRHICSVGHVNIHFCADENKRLILTIYAAIFVFPAFPGQDGKGNK